VSSKDILSWESKGCALEGIPTPDELAKCPGYPNLDRLLRGPVAVIECTEEIPCNPCEEACSKGAIKIGSPITNLPALDEDKCSGCGLCISSCPGLAIFTVDLTYSGNEALVSFPFEYLPAPGVGEKVVATDRQGREVCEGKVIRILGKPRQDRTLVVSISVPKECGLIVRGISRKKARPLKTHGSSPDLISGYRILNHPVLGPQGSRKKVAITVDGRKIGAKDGEMIVTTLLGAGIRINRYTAKYHEPRGLFCGIGLCTDCVMTVNGIPNVRTCVTPVEDGMTIETQHGNGK